MQSLQHDMCWYTVIGLVKHVAFFNFPSWVSVYILYACVYMHVNFNIVFWMLKICSAASLTQLFKWLLGKKKKMELSTKKKKKPCEYVNL